MVDAQSDEWRQAVEELAKSPSIDSERIGVAGLPSPNFKRYERVVQLASLSDLEALMSHRYPVVRGYAAKGILQKDPKQAAALYPLLADAASVETVNGCNMGSDTVGYIVALALAWNADPVVMPDILVRAKEDVRIPKDVYKTLSGSFASRRGRERALQLCADHLKAHGKNPAAYHIYVTDSVKTKGRVWTNISVESKLQKDPHGRPAGGRIKIDLETGDVIVVTPIP